MSQQNKLSEWQDRTSSELCFSNYLDISEFFNGSEFMYSQKLQDDHQHMTNRDQKQFILFQKEEISKGKRNTNSGSQKITEHQQVRNSTKNSKIFHFYEKEYSGHSKQPTHPQSQRSISNIQQMLSEQSVIFDSIQHSFPIIPKPQAGQTKLIPNKGLYKGFLNTAKLIILSYIEKKNPKVYEKHKIIRQLLKCKRKTNRIEIQMLIQDKHLRLYLVQMFTSGFFYNQYQNGRVKIANHRLFMKKAALLKKSIIYGQLLNLS